MTIAEWIDQATDSLKKAGIGSARLDAEITLAHTLRKGRTYLHAYRDDPIPLREQEIADARLRLRCDRTPIAYIIGHKEFYGRRFRVTPSTLIPRPESEEIITVLKKLLSHQTNSFLGEITRLVDVGTGSGILGITAKLEFPALDVTLLDVSKHALNVAEQNAKDLGADVAVVQSDLLTYYPFNATFIVANLPYVDPSWDRSPETEHEPQLALFAKDHGLHLIKNLITQAATRLEADGALILEADPRQHEPIKTFAGQQGFSKVKTHDFVVVLQK
jgi:release factor glutamine methyltransferase